MELRIVEAAIYTGLGLILLIAALILRRKTKLNTALMIYAGILLLLGALLTLLGWVHFGEA